MKLDSWTPPDPQIEQTCRRPEHLNSLPQVPSSTLTMSLRVDLARGFRASRASGFIRRVRESKLASDSALKPATQVPYPQPKTQTDFRMILKYRLGGSQRCLWRVQGLAVLSCPIRLATCFGGQGLGSTIRWEVFGEGSNMGDGKRNLKDSDPRDYL